MKEKLSNYGLWTAVSALGLLIIQDAGLVITPEKYNIYVNLILGIMVLLGIVSDPKSGRFWKDEEKIPVVVKQEDLDEIDLNKEDKEKKDGEVV